jgi:arylsulfatase A-like enzyme
MSQSIFAFGRRFPLSMLLGSLLCVCAVAPGAPTVTSRPNVIMVVVDQFRPDLCGAYGGGLNIATPNIDRLATQGLTFNNAISICPLCTPFRAMVMSGRYGSHTGSVINFTQFNPRQPTLGKAFQAAGYETGFIGKWHLAAGYLKEAGKFKPAPGSIQKYREKNPNFDFVPPGPERLGFEYWAAYNFHANFPHAPYYRDKPEKLIMDGYETDAEFSMGIDFMRQRQRENQPFFLVIAPHPPHPPFRPDYCPAGYLEKIPEKLVWNPNVPEDHPRRKNPLQMRCYLAMAKNFDDNVGRLLDFLDESHLAGDAIVIVTSDHGEMHGSHGRTDKMVPYAEAVRIPMIIRWPGHIEAGRHTDTLQTPVDHFPTLCALAGLKPPETTDGVDLSGEILGRGKTEREAVLMMNYSSHWDYFQTGTNWPEWRGVKTKRYTYVKWLSGGEELYDDQLDPYQMRNLVESPVHQATLARLRERLHDLLAKADDAFLPGTAYADWFDQERNVIKF